MSLTEIESLFESIDLQDYNQSMYQLIKLSGLIHEYEGETESIWYLGESGEFTLMDLLVGAYWHFSDYHRGQGSASYETLSAIGQIYSPNFENGPDTFEEESVYRTLQSLAEG